MSTHLDRRAFPNRRIDFNAPNVLDVRVGAGFRALAVNDWMVLTLRDQRALGPDQLIRESDDQELHVNRRRGHLERFPV